MKVFSAMNASDQGHCNFDEIFGAKYLLNSADVMEFHKTHLILICFLVLKELFIYFSCVRRAASKLKKEAVMGVTNSFTAKEVNDNFLRH